MLSIEPQKIPTAEAILASKFIKRFLFEESLKKYETAIDEELGQPFELYTEQYEEKRQLGEGGMGKVMLVKQKKRNEDGTDGGYFAAKHQLENSQNFENAKKEVLML